MVPLYISGVTCVVTLGGGFLALWLKAQRGLVLAFCAGALVASALLEVVPEALTLLESTQGAWHHHHLLFACSLGFLVFYLLEYTTHGGTAQECHVHHAHPQHAGVWGAAGIGLHSFLDGFAIGQGFQAGSEMGWVITLAVLLHKLADGVSTVGVMLGTHHTLKTTMAMLMVTALAPIAGVLAQALFVMPLPLLALLLGCFAGVFLYLGASSLLPAAHEASHWRGLPLVTLSGAVFIYLAHVLTE
jgi:ZIP family zinc transporter